MKTIFKVVFLINNHYLFDLIKLFFESFNYGINFNEWVVSSYISSFFCHPKKMKSAHHVHQFAIVCSLCVFLADRLIWKPWNKLRISTFVDKHIFQEIWYWRISAGFYHTTYQFHDIYFEIFSDLNYVVLTPHFGGYKIRKRTGRAEFRQNFIRISKRHI